MCFIIRTSCNAQLTMRRMWVHPSVYPARSHKEIMWGCKLAQVQECLDQKTFKRTHRVYFCSFAPVSQRTPCDKLHSYATVLQQHVYFWSYFFICPPQVSTANSAAISPFLPATVFFFMFIVGHVLPLYICYRRGVYGWHTCASMPFLDVVWMGAESIIGQGHCFLCLGYILVILLLKYI